MRLLVIIIFGALAMSDATAGFSDAASFSDNMQAGTEQSSSYQVNPTHVSQYAPYSSSGPYRPSTRAQEPRSYN